MGCEFPSRIELDRDLVRRNEYIFVKCNFRTRIGDFESLLASSHGRVKVIEQVIVVDIGSPIAELNQADSIVRSEIGVYEHVRFAAAIIWIIEQDEVICALKGIGTGSVTKPRILSQKGLMY